MTRRLFLTGPMGCGKTTAITTALGDRLPHMGGFLTDRRRDEQGRTAVFSLSSADGTRRAAFLELTDGTVRISMDTFSDLGCSLLCRPPLVLDEIGGIELLCTPFVAALDALLLRDIPMIGVLKAPESAQKLARFVGLTEEYFAAADQLRRRLEQDPHTTVFRCRHHDPEALRLAQQWRKEYGP